MKDEINSLLNASDIFGLIFSECAPNPVFTVENSAVNNPIHTILSKTVHTRCMVSNPLLQRHSPTARPAELRKVEPAQF